MCSGIGNIINIGFIQETDAENGLKSRVESWIKLKDERQSR